MVYMKILGSKESQVDQCVKKVPKVHRLMLPLEERPKQPKRENKGQHSASLGR